ncbi:quinolinate synthase NadA [Ancylomarina sp. YFZ004]
MDAMRDKVLKIAKEKNAVILAHYYQTPDIQEIADFKGDSLALAQYAAETKADIILFAGVHFMGETAKILNPNRKVLIPDMNAGCSLAESCPGDEFAKFKAKYPDHIVISYINCSAEIKTLSDVICTSGNAVQIVESYPKDQKIIFAPDKNLGRYINEVTGREMILWDGSCEVHDILSAEKIMQMKIENPDATLIAHPECTHPVLILADFVGSTTAMLNYTKNSESKKFIVATETGILHQMKKDSPEKEFLIVPADESCACNDCAYMKLNTMEKIYLALKNEQPEIILPKDIMEKAKAPLLRMLDLSIK